MAKNERVYNEEEKKQLEELKKQLSDIKNKGKFMKSYVALRIGTNNIRKSETSEIEKKKALFKLCEDVATDLKTTMQENKKK